MSIADELLAQLEEDEAEFEPCMEQLRMCLAEAGYPDAVVWWGGTGIFIEDVPEAVQERAWALVNGAPS